MRWLPLMPKSLLRHDFIKHSIADGMTTMPLARRARELTGCLLIHLDLSLYLFWHQLVAIIKMAQGRQLNQKCLHASPEAVPSEGQKPCMRNHWYGPVRLAVGPLT